MTPPYDADDPRWRYHGPMDSRLFEGRHQGDSMEYAQEVARRLGPDAIVIKHGEYSIGVYKPKFKPLRFQTEGGTAVELRPQQFGDRWEMSLFVADKHISYLSRGDMATLCSSIIPDASALLTSLNAGRAGDRSGAAARRKEFGA